MFPGKARTSLMTVLPRVGSRVIFRGRQKKFYGRKIKVAENQGAENSRGGKFKGWKIQGAEKLLDRNLKAEYQWIDSRRKNTT